MSQPPPAPEPPLADERWDLVQRVVGSQRFRKSPRLHDFLLYICESTLRNRPECVREQQIGTQVFRRRPDYNMSEDSIVRVEARELRKRLESYFETEGKDEPTVIKIPKGSYVPVFEPRGVAVEESEPKAERETCGEKPSPEVRWKPWAAALAAGLVLVALGLWLGVRKPAGEQAPTRAGARAAAQPAQDYSFYYELLGPLASDADAPTLVVLSNPRVLLYGGSMEPAPPGMAGGRVVPAPPEVHKLPQTAMNNADEKLPYRFFRITNEDYTGMGEAACAFHLGRLMQTLKRPVRLTQGRFLNWESARKQHLVILGSPHINDWTQQNVLKGNFRFVPEAVQNTQPLPGEPAAYHTQYDEKTGFPLLDHGVISMQNSPAGSRILVLAGRSSAGTYGVGEFFANPETMRPVYERLKSAADSGSFPSNWQVLLRLEIRDSIPIASSYVTHRVYSNSGK